MWVQDHLFSVDSDGQLLQWDLDVSDVKKVMRVTGSAATCIDVNPEDNLIVVGTEEGYLNLFSVSEENGVLYNKIIDKQEGRVVCVTFDPSGKFLATGSVDYIRVWNVETGHVLHKMSVPRLEAKKEAIVWCVTFVKDLKIISGDSTGRLTIWDGKLGVQVSSMTASKVDILALAVTEDLNTLYCSGVDPDIKEYSEITIRKESQETRQWVRGKGRKIHNHDVHALLCYNKRLFSGGQDGFLTVSSYPPKIVNKYGPFLTRPSATISQEQRLILLKYVNYLEVWRLGTVGTKNEQETSEIMLKDHPKKLLELKSKNGHSIIDAKMSSDGKWIAYSTSSFVKMFHFETKTLQKPVLTNVEVPKEMMETKILIFNHKSDTIYVTKSNTVIEKFILVSNVWQYQQSIDLSNNLNGSIRQLQLSACSKYFACLTSNNEIAIFHLNKKWDLLLVLPKHSHPATAMAFRPNCKSIVIAFSDQKVFEYNLEEKCFIFTCFADCGNSRHPIIGITFDPRRPEVVLLQTELGIHVLSELENDDDGNEEEESSMKKNKKGDERRSGRYKVKTVKNCEVSFYIHKL